MDFSVLNNYEEAVDRKRETKGKKYPLPLIPMYSFLQEVDRPLYPLPVDLIRKIPETVDACGVVIIHFKCTTIPFHRECAGKLNQVFKHTFFHTNLEPRMLCQPIQLLIFYHFLREPIFFC